MPARDLAARWMTPDEAARIATFDSKRMIRTADGLWNGTSDGQVWLGIEPTPRSRALAYGDDRHVMLTCGSRGGLIVSDRCLLRSITRCQLAFRFRLA